MLSVWWRLIVDFWISTFPDALFSPKYHQTLDGCLPPVDSSHFDDSVCVLIVMTWTFISGILCFFRFFESSIQRRGPRSSAVDLGAPKFEIEKTNVCGSWPASRLPPKPPPTANIEFVCVKKRNENKTKTKAREPAKGGAKHPPVGCFPRFVFVFVLIYV